MKARITPILFLLIFLGLSKLTFAEDKFDWNGFYGSFSIGRSWSHITENPTQITSETFDYGNQFESRSADEFNAWDKGLRLGFNKQFDKFLVGMELSGNWENASNKITPPFSYDVGPPSIETHIKSFQTITARTGYIFNENTLIFGTGGLAISHIKRMLDDFDGWFGKAYKNKTLIGYEVGFGAEQKLGQHWSLRADYEYVNFGKNKFNYTTCYEDDPGTCPGDPLYVNQSNSIHFSNLSAGVSYAF